MNNAQIVKACKGSKNLKRELQVETRRLKKLNEKVHRLESKIQAIAGVTDIIDGVALRVDDSICVDDRRFYTLCGVGSDFRRYAQAYDAANMDGTIGLCLNTYGDGGYGGFMGFYTDWDAVIDICIAWVVHGEKRDK